MNALDIILLFLLGRGAYTGYQRGLVMEVAQLLGIIVALITATYLTPWILHYVDKENIPFQTITIPFIVIFCIVLVAWLFLGRLVQKIVHFTFLKEVNAIGGGTFGLLKWSVIIGLVLIWIQKSPIQWTSSYLSQSTLWHFAQPYVESIIQWGHKAFAYVPDTPLLLK